MNARGAHLNIVDPPPRASDGDDLARMYERRFGHSLAYRRSVWRTLMDGYFLHHLPSGGRVLDVGCGYGDFINIFPADEPHAMDLNPDTVRFVASHVQVHPQDASTAWPFADGSLDLVFSSNFLEHLPGKAAVASTLAEAARCLRPGGHIVLMGPNVRVVPGSYWDFWDHYVPLTERSVSEVLNLSGLQIVTCHARFLPYTMSQGRQRPVVLLALYLRLRPLWWLFGGQFLIIARRPGL